MSAIAQDGYLNARAVECFSAGQTAGEPAVWFQGEQYFVIGLYFARRGQDRELYYVLRPAGSGHSLSPLEIKALAALPE